MVGVVDVVEGEGRVGSICWGIWRGEERVRREGWEKKKRRESKKRGGERRKETCMLGE